MREILFRGKREDNGEWVYGYYSRFGYTDKEKDYIIPHYASDLYAFEIIPETVGQYTGLTDKNGTKIFEGDVLLVNGVQKVRVFFEKGQFVINHFALNLLSGRNLDGEVIGNIHDNPELLGVE